MEVDAVILARGGSRGIPRKNLIDFCGKPLIYWTIKQCLASKYVREVWVSSDNIEILNLSAQFGAKTINRPTEISTNQSSSESSWIHSVDYIEEKTGSSDLIIGPQVTSPLRETSDIDSAIEKFEKENCDSMFSCSTIDDIFLWKKSLNGKLIGANHDYLHRKRRQDMPAQIVENGSFYLFKPSILKEYNNRLGGKISSINMDYWKMFEIDTWDDVRICSSLMKEFLL